MKICIVLDSQIRRSPVGGVEKATHALCMGLLQAGHDVTLIASGANRRDTWAEVATVGAAPSGRLMLVWGVRRWNRTVVGALTDLRPDVAQGQGLGFAGNAVVRWRRGPSVVVAHGNILEDLRYSYSRAGWMARAPLARRYGMNAVRTADALVNVASSWRVNCPIEPAKHLYIPNPIDEAFFSEKSAPEPDVVACFGGTKRIKGVDLLLAGWPRVLREVPSARLDLYGFDAEETRLPRSCRALAALCSSREVAAAMGRASVLAIPSRFEVSPLAAAEAMAVGVPIVATDVGGVRAMTSGVARLCQADASDLAASIVWALRNPSAFVTGLREGRMRSNAFRLDRVVESYVSLYESLV